MLMMSWSEHPSCRQSRAATFSSLQPFWKKIPPCKIVPISKKEQIDTARTNSPDVQHGLENAVSCFLCPYCDHLCNSFHYLYFLVKEKGQVVPLAQECL
jgi:hypothetical protein